MDYNKLALAAHEKYQGKVAVASKMPLETADDLSIAYTPGVAEPCRKIAEEPADVYKYTAKGNLVAVITDGSAVLGLGNIGAEAALPVMEGKAVLFKEFGDVDAFPICVESQDTDTIIETARQIAPTFGGINLEDISAPKCFEIEEKLQAALDIPVFHDDQHGTAVVVTAGLINALKLVDKTLAEISVVISGPGAAGTAIAKMLLSLGVKDIVMVDRAGIIYRGREGLNGHKTWLADQTNPQNIEGDLAAAMVGRDVFIGVSSAGIVTEEMVATMNRDAVIFAMANPDPEILPAAAKAAGAAVVGTGRSDFPNQINNVLAFPGIFRGALDARASRITEAMKAAAAYAIADLVAAEELSPEKVIPSALDKRVAPAVAKAVAAAWEA